MSNCIHLTIRDCQLCPCATLKYDYNSEDDIMYCQTEKSLLMLREGWGSHPIPSWCPILREQKGQRTRYYYYKKQKDNVKIIKENNNEEQASIND